MLQLVMRGSGDQRIAVEPVLRRLELCVRAREGEEWNHVLSRVPRSLFHAIHTALAGGEGLDEPVKFTEDGFEGRIARESGHPYKLTIVRGVGWSEVTVEPTTDDLVNLAYWSAQLSW